MGEQVRSDSPLSDLPRNAALLVEGPPMTGKYELLLTILAHYSESTIVITTKNNSDQVEEDLEVVAGERNLERVGIVDCVPRPSSVAAPDSKLVRVVGSTENLTRIGVAFTDLFDMFFEEGSSTAMSVGIHSISQLLMHAGLQRTYQFLQVLTGQVRSVNWLLVGVLDANIDEQNRQTLHQHFDGLIETRHHESAGRQLRVRGLSPTSSEWTTF